MAETKKILLVEDDNNLREIYGARLQAEGYEIVSAPDGEQALAIAVKEKPDLIISDIMMPKVSGFDMLDILRNAPETRDTKVIMMTALSQAEDKARADKLGADMYLVKSQVTLEDVTKAVHQILDDPSESTQEAESAAAQEMVSGGTAKEEPASPAPPETPVQPPEPQAEKPVEPPKEEVPAPTPEPVQPAPSLTVEPPQPPEAPPAPEPVAPPPPTDANPAASVTSIPVSIPDDDTKDITPTAVEPSLAQALENEEQSEKEAPPADTTPAPAPVSDEPAQTSPAEPAATENPSDDNTPAENPLDDRPSKKVIKPINDPTKGPDINELIAKEEAKEISAANDPMQANQIIKPQVSDDDNSSQDLQDDQSSTTSKEDFGKISL